MILAVGLLAIGLFGLVIGGELLVRGSSRLAAIAGVSPLVIGLTVVAFGTSAPELAVSVKASLGGQSDIAVGNVVGSNIFNVLFILGISSLISPLIVSSQLIRIDVPLMILASVVMMLFGLNGVVGRPEGIILFTGLIAYTGWTVIKSRKETAMVKDEFEHEFPAQPNATAGQIGLQLLLVVGGLVVLSFGAGWLVDGAVIIARLAGMSELLIGLTIVSVGTSLPEVAASIVASLRGERDIAVGNVVGSCIFNLMCVLGLTASVVPTGVAVTDEALRLDIPVMIAVAVACLPIFFSGVIARWEGAMFLSYYVAYMTYLILVATTSPLLGTFAWVMVLFVVPLTAITLVVSVLRSWRKAKGAAEDSA